MMDQDLDKLNNHLKKTCPEKDQYFFGHGKLLLTGEYFVLEGAQALAIPTKVGQSLSVKYAPSFSPTLNWKSFDVDGKCWFECNFEFWQFKILDEKTTEEALFLQKILLQVRKQNPHFLRDDVDVFVETKLGFPLFWGLGSSSTLVYNIAQWAYVSPFELLFKTQGGSGYDIACAQSEGPILYRKIHTGPNWTPVQFNPSFKDQLFFIYLGNKKDSRQSIKSIASKRPFDVDTLNKLSEITQEILKTNDQDYFNRLLLEHETIVSNTLELDKVQDLYFSDFKGVVKSLGAWGGDFILASTQLSYEESKRYFESKGFQTFYRYNDLVQDVILPSGTDLLSRHQSSSFLQ